MGKEVLEHVIDFSSHALGTGEVEGCHRACPIQPLEILRREIVSVLAE